MTADGAPAAAASAPGEDTERPSFDSSVAHVARVYDYLLGGKDNYAADRAAAEAGIRPRRSSVRGRVRRGLRKPRLFSIRNIRQTVDGHGIGP